MRKADKKWIVKQCSKWVLENYVFLTYNDIVFLKLYAEKHEYDFSVE